MNEGHDEALVERVALAMARVKYGPSVELAYRETDWHIEARAVIYPPAPPKTRLQVARELLAAGFDSGTTKESILNGYSDSGASIEAILSALALPAMED